MKTPKIKRYRLGVSRTFPTTHPRKGTSTHFISKIRHATCLKLDFCGKKTSIACEICDYEFECAISKKLHTIRGNYPLWEKRMKEVQEGRAVTELFYWSGKPYNSPQVVFATLDKDSGCGVQELKFVWKDINHPWLYSEEIASGSSVCGHFSINDISKNDGLSLEDFKAWFKGYDLSEPMAIIHFTSFRY